MTTDPAPPSADPTTQDATPRQECELMTAAEVEGLRMAVRATGWTLYAADKWGDRLIATVQAQAEALEQARPHLRHRHRCAHIQTSKGACDCGLDAALTTIPTLTGRK